MSETCRICLQPAEPANPLFAPCRCSGTMEFVHENCLVAWNDRKKNGKDRCELCKTALAKGNPLASQSEITRKHYWIYARHLAYCVGAGVLVCVLAAILLSTTGFVSSLILGMGVKFAQVDWPSLFVPNVFTEEPLKAIPAIDHVFTGSKYYFAFMAFGPIYRQVYYEQELNFKRLRAEREGQPEGEILKIEEGFPNIEDFAKLPDPTLGRITSIISNIGYPSELAQDVVAGILTATYLSMVTSIPIAMTLFLFYVGQALIFPFFALLTLVLAVVRSPWTAAVWEVVNWNPSTNFAIWTQYVLVRPFVVLTMVCIPTLIYCLRLHWKRNRPDDSIVADISFLLFLPSPVIVFLPYLHGVVVVCLATGEWRMASPECLAGWVSWLVGAVCWWDHRCLMGGGREDFIGQPEMQNYVDLFKLFREMTWRNALVVGVCKVGWLLLGMAPVTLSLSWSHLPVYACCFVVLGTSIAQNQPPLASFVWSWLNGLASPGPINQNIPLLKRTIIMAVLGVAPLWVGRGVCSAFGHTPNDLLVWAVFLTLELAVLGLLLLKCSSEFKEKQAARCSPIIRSRSILASLAFLCVFLLRFTLPSQVTWLAPMWIVPDMIFRLLTIFWPDPAYSYILIPFMFVNTQGFLDIPQMMALLAISGEWRIPVGLFHTMMRKTYPHSLMNYRDVHKK